MEGAPSSVGSRPAGEVSSFAKVTVPEIPGIDASKLIGAPGTAPRIQPEKKRMSYVELFKALNPQKPETEEERAMREKREKREAVLAAVGDGISALSNLFFTTRYAPNAYDASKGMTAKARERWDRLRMEREANRRAYNDGYLRAAAMDEAGDREDRNWRHTLERERIADGRYEVKAAQDKAMADLNEKLRRHQISAAEYEAEQERLGAMFAEDTEKLKQEYLRAGVRQRNAAAGASTAKANAENRRELKEFSAWDENGKEWRFKDEDAAISFARQHGTYEEGNTTTSETVTEITPGRKDSKGNQITKDKTKTSTKKTTKSGNGYARRPTGEWSSTSKIKW